MNAPYFNVVHPTELREEDVQEIRTLAMGGHGGLVYALLRSRQPLPGRMLKEAYVFLEAVRGGIQAIARLHNEAAELPKADEIRFLETVIEEGLAQAQKSRDLRRQHFMAVLEWCDRLIEYGHLDRAARLVEKLQTLGMDKFPGLALRGLTLQARMDNLCGRFERAYQRLLPLLERPFLLDDHTLLAAFFREISSAALKSGRLAYYKEILFQALRSFFTDIEARKHFTFQISFIYRHFWRVCFAREVTLAYRILFLIHWLLFRLQEIPLLRRIPTYSFLRKILLGYVYVMNIALPSLFRSRAIKKKSFQYLNAAAPTLPVPRVSEKNALPFLRRHILITRAMGGIGDLLMMTPALHALKKRYPRQEIHLALPERYFALFEGNPEVRLIDIEKDPIHPHHYKHWFNLTDCPAARGEALHAPRVRKSRIQLFARGMGLRGPRLWFMSKRPRYTVLPEEAEFARQFWQTHALEGKQVIGIQRHADEVYRDYPYMESLALLLARTHPVLVFDSRIIEGFEHPNIHKIDSVGLRQAFALAARCQLLIAPDSAFVHFAAALNIPCIALFGPIDGKVRTKHYPHCQFVDIRQHLGCIPCWRNEDIPCKLTGGRTSACLENLPVQLVYQKVQQTLEKLSKKRHDPSQQSM